jgi:hypothetical protein
MAGISEQTVHEKVDLIGAEVLPPLRHALGTRVAA